MWFSGGESREKWFKFRFRLGQLIEGAVRYFDGKQQGTMLVEVTEAESTDSKGHWFKARYVQASDSHLRWWMTSGDGARLAKGCRYHCCDGSAADCSELKKGKGIHFEKFREITQEETNVKVPAWAFGRQCNKVMSAFLKGRGAQAEPRGAAPELPWREPVSRKKQMRRSLSRVESLIWKRSFKRQGMQSRSLKSAWQREPRRMTRKGPGNQQSVRGRSHLQRAEKKGRGLARDHDPMGVVVAGAHLQGDGRRGRVHQLRPQGGHPAQEESCLEETEVAVKLAAREVTGIEGPLEVEKPLTSRRALTRGRGLFGTLLQIQRPWTRCVWFSNVQYAKKRPGRLPSRLLLKMRREGAQGFVGADPAQAADLITQRVKALEKSTVDAHWGSAQFLDIFGGSQSRRSRTSGEGRGVLHLPGISERPQMEGVQPMERPPRGQGRSRKRRAQGQGERKRQRKREAESQRVEAGVDKMAEWQWSWKDAYREAALTCDFSGSVVDAPQGGFSQVRSFCQGLLFGLGVPPGLKPLYKLFRGDDLFPIKPKEDGRVIADSVQGMVTVLNYLALCSGNAPVPEEVPDRPLTKPQERVVDHLRKEVSYLKESGQVVRSFEESSVPLGVARFGYDGMEDIQADLVVAAWPWGWAGGSAGCR